MFVLDVLGFVCPLLVCLSAWAVEEVVAILPHVRATGRRVSLLRKHIHRCFDLEVHRALPIAAPLLTHRPQSHPTSSLQRHPPQNHLPICRIFTVFALLEPAFPDPVPCSVVPGAS